MKLCKQHQCHIPRIWDYLEASEYIVMNKHIKYFSWGDYFVLGWAWVDMFVPIGWAKCIMHGRLPRNSLACFRTKTMKRVTKEVSHMMWGVLVVIMWNQHITYLEHSRSFKQILQRLEKSLRQPLERCRSAIGRASFISRCVAQWRVNSRSVLSFDWIDGILGKVKAWSWNSNYESFMVEFRMYLMSLYVFRGEFSWCFGIFRGTKTIRFLRVFPGVTVFKVWKYLFYHVTIQAWNEGNDQGMMTESLKKTLKDFHPKSHLLVIS